jgi:hypothetical protein
MGGARSDKKVDYLRFSLDLPNVKFELQSACPEHALPEVRRILEALNTQEPEPELAALELTDEFMAFAPLRERVKSAVALGEDVKVLKRVIPVEQEYDLESGKRSRQVVNVKTSLWSLFDELRGDLRDCYAHIRGDLSTEQQHAVMDALRQRVGVGVQPRFFSTKKNLEGNVLVEAVCFGDRLSR